MPPPAPDRPWHATDAAAVAAHLGTGPDGLRADVAADRLAEQGPNAIPGEALPSALALLVRQFASPLVLILVVAAGVTLALRELLDTALIVGALTLNAVIGFTQERRAASAVHALMQLIVPRCRVVRDGVEQEIDSRDVVVGDLVVLETGSRLPADLRLAQVNALTVDESLLTGESLPVAKQVEPVAEDAALGDRRSLGFTGTIVASGRGRGYVVATALDTELGRIADEVRTVDALETPLQERMRGFARLIGVACLVASAITFVSGIARGESAEEMFRTAVAMAVSAVPEALPVATTVTLAIGVSRMARRHAVLRRLPALETLGSTTVIGSDKTGTLTENRMTVEAIWAGGRWYEVPEDLPPPDRLTDRRAGHEALHLTLLAGVLANEATPTPSGSDGEPTGDPTETALLTVAVRAGLDPAELRERHDSLHEIPFEPDRRYSASTRRVDGRPVAFVKGAPERMLQLCTHQLGPDGAIVPLDADAVLEAADRMAARGMRVLAMAHLPLDDGVPLPDGRDEHPRGLVLTGIQGMDDPPRPGVTEAIRSCRRAGIRVVMVTGDHPSTARAIAARLGIADEGAPVLTSADLAGLDHDALRRAVHDVSVFARVSPHDKLRIVRAIQDEGHIVAVTGDGVNDAPALRAADIGVAMGLGGTDVAREAADMVLSDDNFVSIVAAVEEGRIAFGNIRKVAFFLISTAVAETFAIMMTVWLGWPLLLVPAQILWLNVVTNGVQDLALAFEPGSPGVLRRPPRPLREGILSPTMWERTVLVGVVMAAGALHTFRWELDRNGSLVSAQSVALTTLVMFNVFQAGNSRTENRSLFSLAPWSNRFLFWSTLAAVTTHAAALHLAPTQYVLGVEPIDLAAWVRGVVVAASILVVVEAHKAIRRRWPRRPGPGRPGRSRHPRQPRPSSSSASESRLAL